VVTTAALYAYVDDMDLALARAREAGLELRVLARPDSLLRPVG
jgi:hypothetical protein